MLDYTKHTSRKYVQHTPVYALLTLAMAEKSRWNCAIEKINNAKAVLFMPKLIEILI
jgi:hypothetical protein